MALAIHRGDVIRRLPRPPDDHPLLQDERTREWYLRKFHDNAESDSPHEAEWLRYRDDEDVVRWAAFIASHLASATERFVTKAASALPRS